MKKLLTVAILLLVVTSVFSQKKKRFRPWQDKFYIKGGYNMPMGEFQTALDTTTDLPGNMYGFQVETGGLFIIRGFELSSQMRFGLDINASFQRNWKNVDFAIDTFKYEVPVPGTGRTELVTGPIDVKAVHYLNQFGVKFGPTITLLPSKWMYIDFYAKAFVAAAYWGGNAKYTSDKINEKRTYGDGNLPELTQATIKPCFGINWRFHQLLVGAEFTTKAIDFQETPNSDIIRVQTTSLAFNIGVNL